MHTHTCTSLALEDLRETPSAANAKKGWRNTSLLPLCLPKSRPHMTETTRLCTFSTRQTQNTVCLRACPKSFKVGYVCACVCSRLICKHECASASCIHLRILHHLSAPWLQRSCVNTRPQHALSRQSACQGGREMDPAHVPATNKGGRRVSWETWKGEGRTEEGTDVHLKGRARGQISAKVEWDIWKRESPRDRQEIAAAQKWFIGENSRSTSPFSSLWSCSHYT